jgi:hypothetical protein
MYLMGHKLELSRTIAIFCMFNVHVWKIYVVYLRGIIYDFDQKNYMFWKLVNSFNMMK